MPMRQRMAHSLTEVVEKAALHSFCGQEQTSLVPRKSNPKPAKLIKKLVTIYELGQGIETL